MSVYEEFVEAFTNNVIPNVINALRQFTLGIEEEENAILNSVEKDIEHFRTTGVLTFNVSSATNKNGSSGQKSSDEEPVPKVKRYTRRNNAEEVVLSDIKNVVNDHNILRSTRIQIERATNDFSTTNTDDVVKQEMPPPRKRPVCNKRKVNNQSVVPDPEVKEKSFDTSVIEIPKAPVEIIVLDDSRESNKPARVTRARTKRKETNREESESLPEYSTKKIKVERTTKRKQIGNNESGVTEISPRTKKVKGNLTKTDASVIEVQNATLVKETAPSPQKKVKGKAANVKQGTISTVEPLDVGSSEGETAEFPRQTRAKKQISKSKSNSIKGDEEHQSTFRRTSSKKKRTRGKKTIIKESKDPDSPSDEDQANSPEQDTIQKNAETSSSEGETLDLPQKINGWEKNGAAINNETVCIANPTILKEKQPFANETMVISKPSTVDDLMTDDEDFVPNTPPVQQKQGNQIFSPYESSPVKKRVQAFEKLETKNAGAARVTRSKPKVGGTPKTLTQIEAFEKLQAAAHVTRSKANLESKGPHMSTSTPKTKIPKLFGTPVTSSKYKNLQPSSATKAATSTVVKSSTGLKASKMEFREREQRRLQKEQEAAQKKEAILQSASEEKRRKREEREMKVLKVKASKEKEKKMRLLSAEQIKEEKAKQKLAEKEAKFLKQKEEAAQKRAAALKKAENEKRNQAPAQDEIPYLASPTPKLPTPDCYDSDEEASSRGTMVIPRFQQKQTLEKTLLGMRDLMAYRSELFVGSAETPNLSEIFPGIHVSKLKRTSSGIWNETERSVLELMIEEDEAD